MQKARPLIAIGWMFLAGLFFVAVTAIVKSLGVGLPAAQAAFLRYAIGLVLVLPVLRKVCDLQLPRRVWGLVAARAVFHTGAVALWFFAMTRIPLAEVSALNYLSPIYITLGAALFLGETFALRRFLAILVALIGALVILRPGMRELSMGHFAMLATGMCFAGSYLIAKRLTGFAGPGMIVALLSVSVALGLAPLAIAVWVPPTAMQVAMLGLTASFATAGHYAMTRAMAAAPMAVSQPVTFLQLVWAVLLGSIVFGEAVDAWVVLGGALVVGAVSFISWREYVLSQTSVEGAATPS